MPNYHEEYRINLIVFLLIVFLLINITNFVKNYNQKNNQQSIGILGMKNVIIIMHLSTININTIVFLLFLSADR